MLFRLWSVGTPFIHLVRDINKQSNRVPGKEQARLLFNNYAVRLSNLAFPCLSSAIQS
jgi:hypothetical protein